MKHLPAFFALIALHSFAAEPPKNYQSPERNGSSVLPEENMERPLRYTPVGTDFVITNGAEFFNRPLYGGSSAFRVDGGDKPEFSLYLPGHGGNLRLGIRTRAGVKWLNDAGQVVARYRPGSMVHEIRDRLLGDGVLTLTTLTMRATEGVIVRAELTGTSSPVELIWAFGGVDGKKGSRGGDIGCETKPVSEFFQLSASQCAGNRVTVEKSGFRIEGTPGVIEGLVSSEAAMHVSDASDWDNPPRLLATPNPNTPQPLLAGSAPMQVGKAFYLALHRLDKGEKADEALAVYREVADQPSAERIGDTPEPGISAAELARIFDQEEKSRRELAERVVVQTPDPFIDAAATALNVAADAVWDDRAKAYLHGGVAWRVRLLGWRVAYAGDALGWHDRTAAHFAGFAKQQNTQPVPAFIPPPEESANLSRDETALHSNGDLTKSHYDMNLAGVDAFFRHLLWTGDLDYARQMWPAIERHLAWERRLFRREFGDDKLPIYEAYCCIWASDDLGYNGGGATHSSAYNLYHNRMAARVAKLLGRDSTAYEHEADLIAKGMRKLLWLTDRGWFAEWKDLLGRQLVHPNAALWTFYQTVDSEVPTPLEAWQMSRFVDTQIAHIPIRGPSVPDGCFTVPTTSWMPYSWSLNNIVMAETMHTALAYWQAGRIEGAFPLFKGALLDSMYLGLCPGNVGMCTQFDAVRGEAQRDFGDGIGATARALIEGLFGIQPDLLAGVINIRPGFPREWNSARIRHPDLQFSFQREGLKETYALETKFAQPLKLVLNIVALRDEVGEVTVNGGRAVWRVVKDSAGAPRIEIHAPASKTQRVVIEWRGKTPVAATAGLATAAGSKVHVDCGARIVEMADPQGALSDAKVQENSFGGVASGTVGDRTIFAKISQGDLLWWQPVPIRILSDTAPIGSMDWNKPLNSDFDPIDLTATFNDKVTQIFRNEYRSPRSPFCSLATPKQGIGSWCHPHETFEVDDSGLRAAALMADGRIVLPNGVPFFTPGQTDAKNIAFVSQWDHYPAELAIPLSGKSSRAFLLMAGSTTAMQSRFDNGEIIATYADGSTARLALHNPTTWWPINRDYYIDDFAFARPEPLPVRVDLKTGKIRVLEMEPFKKRDGVVKGGAATVLHLDLNPSKELKSLTVRALANEVVIGLMSVTLER